MCVCNVILFFVDKCECKDYIYIYIYIYIKVWMKRKKKYVWMQRLYIYIYIYIKVWMQENLEKWVWYLLFPSHTRIPPQSPLLLSDFSAPKVFSLALFSWLHQTEVPAPLSLLFSLFFVSFFSPSYMAALHLSPKQNISL